MNTSTGQTDKRRERFRISFVLLCLGGFLFAGLGTLSGAAWALDQEAGFRPNFVLILVDDAGLMDFGAYGGEAKPPNIDRSFALDAPGADNWEQKKFMPYYNEAPWYTRSAGKFVFIGGCS